jgi:hypothetical protein
MKREPGFRLPLLLVLLAAILLSARTAATTVIDYQWWKEMRQVETWLSLIGYSALPVAAAALLSAIVLTLAFSLGARFSGMHLGAHRTYSRIAALVLLLVSLIIATATIDTWTTVRYAGSRGLTVSSAWIDPIFAKPLSFYLFDLPFWDMIRQFAFALAVAALLVHWLSARFAQLRDRWPLIEPTGEIDLSVFRLEGGLESRFLRIAAISVLLALAAQAYLGRYAMITSDHGYLVGVDWVDDHIRLPLQWVLIASLLLSALAAAAGRWKVLLLLPLVWIVSNIAPRIISAVHVRPNEIELQRPYLQKHIEATRAAYGLTSRVKEVEFAARLDARPLSTTEGLSRHSLLLDNIRLWDWRAFHDTVTQIQALRPYYVFPDSDVDRYMIDGRLRQVLLSPRELDIRQLADARTRWINPHFVYTHGYGMVMAESNRITADGLPVLFVQDAPAQLKTQSLKLTRPEIYFGEVTHEPVFVRTGQKEFSYPRGNDSVFTRYTGAGGFPIDSFWMRVAAAVRDADPNILLTQLITSDSRMMIRRRVLDRVSALAGFASWDDDPYLVLTDEGRLVWTIDGFTVSGAHPYSHRLGVSALGAINYIRNSVKATVDAYNGDVAIYVFDDSDPLIQAYRALFPKLLQPASAMPASLRQHVRYPETIFRIQAEIYRTYHMRDPQAFYNKEDVWDIARNLYGGENQPQQVLPTYVVATVPGESKPEFLLLLPFTPRSKDNLIGLMAARCDGEHLGELVFLQLSKQALIFGPMQIEARINQDQNISKDLTLWNQQGSQVLRGQMLVLPVGDSFLYVEPIYIQASEARMPQLKKVVAAMGDLLAYRDTYEQALSEISGAPLSPAAAETGSAPETARSSPSGASTGGEAEQKLVAIRRHLARYRELAAQGRWAEAGKELEAMDALARR